MKNVKIWGFLILGIFLSLGLARAEEETAVAVPLPIMSPDYVDSPDPMMVWLKDQIDSPALKSASFPFDSIAKEPSFDYYFKLLEIERSGKKIKFPSQLDSITLCMVRIAKAIVEIHSDPAFAGDAKAQFVTDWIRTYRKTQKNVSATTFSPFANQYFIHDLPGSPKDTDADYAKLTAGFIVAGNAGLIQEITPFLEYADQFIGRRERAYADYYEPFGSISSAEAIEQMKQGVPPGKRINYWPAARAMIANPSEAIPLLRSVLLDSSNPDGMRERAAAFLWEMDRQNYNRALLEDVTADERQSLFGAASNGFKFQSQMAAVWGTNFSPQERSIRKAYLDFMKLQP